MRTRMLTSVFALLAVASPAAAQSEWLAAEGTSIALEYRHPSIDLGEGVDESALTGAYFLSGRFTLPVIGFTGVAEIPFANASLKLEGSDEEAEGNGIGNVYIGAEMPIMLGAATIVGGVRLPTMGEADDIDDVNDPSPLFGFAGGLTDRFDAFVPEAIVPQAGIRLGVPGIPVFDVEANLNANYLILGGDNEEDNDFVLDGGVRGFANLMGLRAGVGLEGFWLATPEEDDDSDSLFYHAGLWADYGFGMFRPSVSFFIPLSNDYSDMVDWTLGLGVEVNLPM